MDVRFGRDATPQLLGHGPGWDGGESRVETSLAGTAGFSLGVAQGVVFGESTNHSNTLNKKGGGVDQPLKHPKQEERGSRPTTQPPRNSLFDYMCDYMYDYISFYIIFVRLVIHMYDYMYDYPFLGIVFDYMYDSPGADSLYDS